jgi:Domain of unknown function (DUF4352)
MQKTKPSTVHKKHALIAAVIGLFVVVGGCSAFALYSRKLIKIGKEEGLTETRLQNTVSSTVNTAVDNGVVELTVGKSAQAQTIPNVYITEEGTKAVCVDVSVRNISGSEKAFIPLEEVSLRAKNGKTYAIAGVLTCAPGVGGPMQVGEVLQGKLGFLLPDTQETYEFLYTPLEKNTKSFIITDI